MIQKSNKVRRKGMILLVVVAFLALFSVMGVTYLIYADSQLRQSADEVNGQDARQDSMRMVDLNPSFLLNFFLERFLYDQADVQTDAAGNVTNATPYSMFSALRGHSLARNIYGANDNPTAIQDKPFSGTGKLNKTVRLNEADNTGASDLPEWMILNYAYPGQTNNMATVYMDPERIAVDTANNNRLISNRYPGNKTSSWNAPYTYPDQNNIYLGWVSSDETKVMPSFYRPWIFGAMDKTNLPVAGSPPTGNMEWINNVGKFKSLRPRPVDHLSTADFNSAGGNTNNLINIINTRISESKLFPYPEADGFDVKNLEGLSSGNDSIWIDVGSPIFKAPDGRKYKILIAPLVLDLDGRINLNVAGNNMAGGNHGSNQGWGPWEINPAKIAQTAEIQAMISSYPNPGQIDLPGRYTGATRYPSGTNGANLVLPKSPSYAMVDYNGAVDLGAAGGEGYFKTPAFNDPDVVPFQSFPYFPSKNYGAAGNSEVSDGTNYNHASIYNPLRPTTFTGNLSNRVFSAKDTATLLNIKAARSNFAASASAQFLPNTFDTQNKYSSNPQVVKNRNLFTTVSSDLARISTPPYLVDSLLSPYQMTGNYPRGNSVAYLPPGTPIQPGATTDVDSSQDMMGNLKSASLRSLNSAGLKLDLSRKLSDYPAVYYPNVVRNITDAMNGSNYYFDVQANATAGYKNDLKYVTGGNWINADQERQIFAGDIFKALIKATGAKDPAAIAVNVNDPDFKALKYLAQLAVNMVDYIDNDDVMTQFVWRKDPGNNAAQDERVFGFELPKLVLNEGYAEIINKGVDAGNEYEVFMQMMMNKKRAKDDFEVHFWVELLNPLNGQQVESPNLYAWLEQDPLNLNGENKPVYQVEILDKNSNSKILIGDPNGAGPWFKPDASTQFRQPNMGMNNFLYTDINDYEKRGCKFVAPSLNSQYQGLKSSNSGFMVIGSKRDFPEDDPPMGQQKKQLELTNIRHPGMMYAIQRGDPMDANGTYSKAKIDQSIADLQNHKIVLKRLANPYRVPNNTVGDPNYNPYIEVDNLTNLRINDAVKYAADDERTTLPESVNDRQQRTSVAKSNPYQSFPASLRTYLSANLIPMTMKYDTELRVSDTNSPGFVKQFAAGQPQTTLLRHNASWVDNSTKQFPYKVSNGAGGYTTKQANAGVLYQPVMDDELMKVVPDPETRMSLPGKWLVHLDRAPVSWPEILHVTPFAPKDVTFAFYNPAITDGTNPIGHKAPWLDGGSRLARFLEFVQVKSRQSGVAQDGKQPGLININSIWDVEVFRALADARQTYDPKNPNNFIEPEVDVIFSNLLSSRSPNNFPTMGDNPFWSLGVGQANGGDEWTGGTRGLNNTILRNNGGLFDLLDQNTNGQNRDAYQKKELLNKIANNITTKSNTFGIWLTTGYFEVTDDTVMPPKLGAEIGKSEGTNIRHRMFAIVDRANMVGYRLDNAAFSLASPTQNLDLGMANTIKLTNPANGRQTFVADGMTLTFEPNTDNEETVLVRLYNNTQNMADPLNGHLVADFQKAHNSTGSGKISIILRGNPGPWAGYDRTKDKDVVIYSEIIE